MRRGAERRAYSKNIPNNVQFRTAQPISGPRQQTPAPGAGGLGSLVRNTSEDRAKDRTNNARHVALVPAACATDRCPFPPSGRPSELPPAAPLPSFSQRRRNVAHRSVPVRLILR